MKCKLCDIADISAGQGAPQGGQNYCDNGIPFVKAGNLADLLAGQDIKDIQKVNNEVAQKHKLKLYEKDSVLFAKSGMSCMKGYVYVLPSDSYVVSHLAIVTPRKVEPKYLKYFFQHHKPNQLIKDAAYPSISLSDIADMDVEIPDKERVEEIILSLENIENIIASRVEELNQLDILIKARFVEMFGDPSINPMGWDRVNISEVVGDKVSNGFFAKRDDYIDDGNVSVMGVAYIVNRMYSRWQDLPRTNGTDKDIEKYEVKYGDMLFCRSSLVAEGIGKASIVPEDVPENTLFECHVIRLPLDLRKCVPEYMQVFSTMDFFRQQIIAQSKTATMTTIGQDGILKADILLPPLDRQQEFYDFVKLVDKSKVVVQKQIELYTELFDKLMYEYFG